MSNSARKPRLAILTTHPIQYYAPVYRALAQRGVIEPTVIYLTDGGATAHVDPGFGRTIKWDVPLLEGYDYRVLEPGVSLHARGFWQRHSRTLTKALADAQPDWLLLYGYASRMNWVAARWARQNQVKLAYTSDSNSLNPERMVSLKKLVVRRFFSRVDVFLAPSERNVEYLLRYHANPRKIRRIPFAIDVARFSPPAESERPRRYDFIWAGKFTPRKRGNDFIGALDSLSRKFNRTVSACIVGDGPCRDELIDQAGQLPENCRLEFVDFVNQRGMPQALRTAHILVFTSENEPYGLAATEAAASGLALVVAEGIGCVGSTVLAQPNVNTLTYKAGDVWALATAMDRLLKDPALLAGMQQASLMIAREHDVSCAARVIEQVMREGSTT